MKSAKKYWELVKKMHKLSDAKEHDKCFEACEEIQKFLPCKHEGYFSQILCMMWNGKRKRLLDYDKYETNYLMIKRFWN